MKERDINYVIALAVAFVAATMTANVMSMRMVAPFGVVMDAGTILYPLTFLVRDQIHKRAGKQISDAVVFISVMANLAMFGCFFITAALPYDPLSGEQEEFGRVLLPGILLVLGSVTAQLISEKIDGIIYHRIYRGGEGSAIKAALISNFFSVPIDGTVTTLIAFSTIYSFETCVSTTVAGIVLKYSITLIALASSVGVTNVIAGLRMAKDSNGEKRDAGAAVPISTQDAGGRTE